MNLIIIFLILSFITSAFVVAACMLSARISETEAWAESYDDYVEQENTAVSPQSSYAMKSN